MHQAIPYRSWQTVEITSTNCTNSAAIPKRTWNRTGTTDVDGGSRNDVVASVSESAAIVFARKGCCMSHVVKRLLLGLGANPAVYEVDNDEEEVSMIRELEAIVAGGDGEGLVQLPAVFIGGRLFGGLDRVMATHISGDLVPILKQAGALWL